MDAEAWVRIVGVILLLVCVLQFTGLVAGAVFTRRVQMMNIASIAILALIIVLW